MKKLIGMFAIAAIAVSASATTVNWGLSSGETLDAAKIDGGTAYLMYSIGTVDFSKFATMDKFDASSLAAVGLDTTISTFDYSSTTVSGMASVTPTGTKTSAGNNIGGGVKKMYIIFIDDGGMDIAYTANAINVNVQNSTMAFPGTLPASNFTYATVPEPTSGLLLLLGMAGLALKRKRA